ncbi:HCP-like protein [Pluteus cervinus]|uniref:HCP-like protein n=1 Tax=Pluteus cervinus TaxID=181527 RepID=A0ACD3BES6_9AGAR|nr:HCP-like protein [Pluteus cervinus]
MAAPGDHSNISLHNSSPLDTLVRQTSARRPPRNISPAQDLSFQVSSDTHYYAPNEPRAFFQQQQQPASPLLHGQFSRNSSTTYSNDTQSYIDPRSSLSSRNTYQDIRERFRDDDESLYPPYSNAPALRDSWHSTSSRGTFQPVNATNRNPAYGSPYQPPSSAFPQSQIPTLVVSSASSDPVVSQATQAGRTPITRPVASNFSRPGRVPSSDASSAGDSEAKKRVIERNMGRSPSPAGQHIYDTNPLEQRENRSLTPSRPPPKLPSALDTPSTTANQSFLDLKITPEDIILPGRPPSLHPDSPASIYSAYSYYQYNSAGSSPAGATFQQVQSPQAPVPPLTEVNARTPQEFLQLGIQHHEANRLKESAVCFERSAKENGGCGVGKLMWGLALRHGWGCEKNEKNGFKWLRNAAENAVEDLESARGVGGIDTKAVQTELVLAIYEVGQCFFQGWGVPKDQKMAVSYYTVAARLGDPDAQSDLAFCLANGKGCKKDRKEAAKWYRAAVAQGQSDVGLAWIYKDKYQ